MYARQHGFTLASLYYWRRKLNLSTGAGDDGAADKFVALRVLDAVAGVATGTCTLVLHADNGAAQKAHMLKSKLEPLGITQSHSRPGVSYDNAHIEAWSRTCKYALGYQPHGFEDIDLARQWVLTFVTWYNGEHLHSGLSFVTPEQRHGGVADAVLQQRREVSAPEHHPLRWKRPPRAWQVADEVCLNPPPKLDQRHAARHDPQIDYEAMSAKKTRHAGLSN